MKTAEFLWFIKPLLCSGTAAHRATISKRQAFFYQALGMVISGVPAHKEPLV